MEQSIAGRRRMKHTLEEMSKLKQRRVARLKARIHESERVLDLLQKVDDGDEDVIMRTIRRPRAGGVDSLNVSSEALQSISKSIKEARREEEEREREERERQQREAEIRDSMTHSIMKSSAEELKGKVWNARSLFDRVI